MNTRLLDPATPDRLSTVSVGTRADADPVPVDGRSRMRRTGEQTLYILASFPVTMVGAALVGLSFLVGVVLSIFIVGLPILAWSARLARSFAICERRLIRQFMVRPAPAPVYNRSAGSRIRRAMTTLGDPQSWLDIAHVIVGFILRTISFTMTLLWWAGAVGGLGWVLWGWSLRISSGNPSVPELIGLPNSYLIDLIFYTAVGVLCLLTLPYLVRAMAWLNAGPALMMLSSRADLQQEVEYLVKGREAARTAEAGSLRRLERDIHDGPQQRLVRLSMDLGRAKKQIATDPEQARDTLDEAIMQTRQTLDELRALSRGIAPPVLADRGLQAAMQEIIARSTVPVHLQMDVPDELPDHVETAAYFTVSEALVNVAKHSMASYAIVDLSYERKVLTVKVSDDGVGGAQLAKGHGLVGLADRVRSVDGVLNVSSPPGGPTELTAEIACAS